MTRLLLVPVLLPYAGAAACVLLRQRLRAQRAVSLAVASAVLASALALVVGTLEGPLAVRVGGWPAPIAITLVIDTFAALVLSGAAVAAVAALAAAAADGADRSRTYHPVALAMLAGVGLAFTTGDLFTLFVSFEVLLVGSYVLLTDDLRGRGLRAGVAYVAVNLTASVLLVAGIGLIYSAVGTTNLGDLARVGLGGTAPLGAALVLTAVAVKAGVAPVHGWLPVAYGRTAPAVAGLLSGVLTKVGVYALYRLVTLLDVDGAVVAGLLATLAILSMLLGVVSAVGRSDLREILAFHSTSQVGYMVMGLALLDPLALAAGTVFTIHHSVVKSGLFLTAGAVERERGSGRLSVAGGLVRQRPAIAAAFGVLALALAGLPPFSGFVPKLGLLRAAAEQEAWLLAAASVVTSVLTLASMVKIWQGGLGEGIVEPADSTDVSAPTSSSGGRVAVPAGAAADDGPAAPPTTRRPAAVGPAIGLAAVAVVLGLTAGPLLEVAVTAAEGLLDPAVYIETVGTGVELP
ncbi:MAG: complex I subunit 5 family protein [Actinomycetes bacterium]